MRTPKLYDQVYDHVWVNGQGRYFTHVTKWSDNTSDHLWAVYGVDGDQPPLRGDEHRLGHHPFLFPHDKKDEAEAKAESINAKLEPAFDAVVKAIVQEYLSIVGKIIMARPFVRLPDQDDVYSRLPQRVRVLHPEGGLMPQVWPGCDDEGIDGRYDVALQDIPPHLKGFITAKFMVDMPTRTFGKRLPRPLKPL